MPMAGRSPARFVAPLALVAFALALFIVLDRTTGGNDEKEANGNNAAQPAGKQSSGKKEGNKKKKHEAEDLHGQGRRHPVRHRREDRRAARRDPRAQPGHRPADPGSRHGAEARPMIRVLVAALLAVARRRRARARPGRRRAAGRQRAVRHRHGGLDGRRALPARRHRAPPDRIDHQADDGAPDDGELPTSPTSSPRRTTSPPRSRAGSTCGRARSCRSPTCCAA